MKKLFLVGAISYDIGNAEDDFREAKKQLLACGYTVFSPFEHVSANIPYPEQLQACMRIITTNCDGIAVIMNEQLLSSRGALSEIQAANMYAIPVKSVDRWVREAGFVKPVPPIKSTIISDDGSILVTDALDSLLESKDLTKWSIVEGGVV